jgi:hypothetical protein
MRESLMESPGDAPPRSDQDEEGSAPERSLGDVAKAWGPQDAQRIRWEERRAVRSGSWRGGR